MNRARPTGLILAAIAIGWLVVGLSTTVALAQVGSPSAEAIAGAFATASATAGASATAAPAASPGVRVVIETGDPRSDGQGPGVVGEPLLVLAGIVLIGIVTVVTTVVIARATGRA